MSTPSQRSTPPWVGLAVFAYGTVAAAVFAFFVFWRLGMIESAVDLNGFGVIARNLALGKGFTLGYGPTIRRGPFYPFFAAALLKLFGDPAATQPALVTFRPVLVANCLIFGATCYVVYLLARRIFGPRAALLAALICPIIPQSMRYVGMAEVETLMGLVTVLLAYTGLQLVDKPSIGRGAAFGLTAAVGTLTKPVLILYPVVFVVLAALYWRKVGLPQRKAVSAALAVLVCFGAALVPWSLRNRAVTDGQFSGISSNGPGEFLRGYVNAQPKYYLLRQDFGGGSPGEKWDPEASLFEERVLKAHGARLYLYNWVDGQYVMVPSPPKDKTAAQLEVEKDRIEGAEMKRRLLHEPMGFVRKVIVQLGTFWYMVETRMKCVFVGGIAFCLLFAAVLGVVDAHRRKALVWPVVAVIAYNNAFYAAVLALARYSMPVFPTLILLSAGGITFLAHRFLGRLWPTLFPENAG